MRTAIRVVAALCLVALSLTSCSSSGGHDDGQTALPLRTLTGVVALPAGTPIDPGTLEVLSFADRAPVGAGGEFSVLVPDGDLPQAVFVMGAGASPVLIGWVEPGETGPVVIDATSTAVALAMTNPFLTMFSAEGRAAFAVTIRQHNSWNVLVQSVTTAVAASAVGRLSDETEPGLIQMASRVVLDMLAGNPYGELLCEQPWLEDAPGGGIACVNPGVLFYGFRAVREADGRTVTELVGSDRENVEVVASWPPTVVPSSTTRTAVDLGDGSFLTAFSRPDFAAPGGQTPAGMAAGANCARGVVEVLAPLSGVLPERRPEDLGVATWQTGDLAASFAAGDPHAFMLALVSLVRTEAASVASWYWRGSNSSCRSFIEAGCPLLRGSVFATQILAGGERRVPFFGALVTGDPMGSQRIRQVDGVMTVGVSQTAPRAAFSFSPSFAAAGAPVSFDAGACSDVDDPSGGLEVRWDWSSDGVWDTEWSSVRTTQHGFVLPGAHLVTLEVRDPGGLSDVVAHRVNVGGSGGSAAHVIILRDAMPWSPEVPPVLDQMLEILGLTEGDGPGQYEVRGSVDLSTLELRPGTDLVIVQNDQPQTFYNAYARNQVRMLQFAAAGGTLLWGACDLGWNGGSIQAARIALPGGVTLQSYRTWFNTVVLRGSPMVAGLPEQIYGQYASHAGIANLPDGATVYVTDNAGSATLVEFGYGDGWVILTTQPLEWNFYNNWTSGLVMPNVVCNALGLPIIHDFGGIVKPELRGKPAASGGERGLTSGKL